MDDTAILVENLSKTFKLPHEKVSSVKSLFVNMFRGKRSYEKQKVLTNVSFEIKKGEFFGIVGRNGSGKSTLLKLMAGIYTPNQGWVHVNGKLTPFIELGVGFNPELTGRENVYLNGALLGFSRKEMDVMYKDIVDFAELKRFMDQKLKNYSSGMQVRLAFSIAIRAESDILLLDEVLAVGDEAFQRKCYDYFEDLKRQQKTVILVTHDMGAVEKFCTRAIIIENGKIIQEGKANIVAQGYRDLFNQEEQDKLTVDEVEPDVEEKPKKRWGNGKLKIDKARFTTITDSKITIEVQISRDETVQNSTILAYTVKSKDGRGLFGDGFPITDAEINSKQQLKYTISMKNVLGKGEYYLDVSLRNKTETEYNDFWVDCAKFKLIKGESNPLNIIVDNKLTRA
jgi:ABC-2 type transport system ATP-binding protein